MNSNSSSDEHLSDLEDEKEELEEDEKWRRNDYFVDQKVKVKNYKVSTKEKEKEREEMLEEEKEAIKLQKQRLNRIKDDDIFDETIKKPNQKEKINLIKKIKETTDHSITSEEKLEMIIKDSPELIELSSDLSTKLKEIKDEIGPLIKRFLNFIKNRVKSEELVTKEGMSYLEVKFRKILL
jgi:transketolase